MPITELPTDRIDSLTYLQKSIAFIKAIHKNNGESLDTILSDLPADPDKFECMDAVLKDTNTFSREEIAFIKEKRYSVISRWDRTLFPEYHLLSGDTLQVMFEKKGGGWHAFYKKFGSGFHTFSEPIFLRKDTLCLFYHDYSCGYLCGTGHLVLYQKKDRKWEILKEYCDWIS
jgi:hypothetical protein